MRVCVGVGMRSELLMSQLLRIMANLMRPDAAGPAEIGFRAMELLSPLPARQRGPGRSRPPDQSAASRQVSAADLCRRLARRLDHLVEDVLVVGQAGNITS